jgi:hypothetical protein
MLDLGLGQDQAALASSRDIGANAPGAGEAPAPKPRFDRKANHRRYMRLWRARQSALRRGDAPA